MTMDRLDPMGLAPENHRVPRLLRFGVFELDVAARELRREGRLVRLPPQAGRLLIALAERPHEIVSRDHLQRVLWSDGTHVDFDRSLNSAMRKLRIALGDAA